MEIATKKKTKQKTVEPRYAWLAIQTQNKCFLTFLSSDAPTQNASEMKFSCLCVYIAPVHAIYNNAIMPRQRTVIFSCKSTFSTM